MSPGKSGSSGSKKAETPHSPRRRAALKRFVSLVKRKGGKKGDSIPFASGFKLLHVDVFQASCFLLFAYSSGFLLDFLSLYFFF